MSQWKRTTWFKPLNAIVILALFVGVFGFVSYKFDVEKVEATSIFITDTASTTWRVPSDWNSASNSISVIGGGGGGFSGYGGGGGGGAFSRSFNLELTPGSDVGIRVGSGGNPGSGGGDSWICNSTSNCATIGGSAVIVGAKGGSGGGSTNGGAGGAAGSGVGSDRCSGGAGGNEGDIEGGGGGGGAGGPTGDNTCGNGAAGGVGDKFVGGGGGGHGGGTIGGNGDIDAGNGGNGGNNYLGTGGGSGVGKAGDPGTAGGGGGGGAEFFSDGGAGGDGTEWGSVGSGGGGGSAGSTDGENGGAGGDYGGGGGAGTTGGVGAQGIIVIIYTPAIGDAPILYNDDNGATQIAFNNARLNDTSPTFRVSAAMDGAFDRFQFELSTSSDFSGTVYSQTFSGSYTSGVPYNLTLDSLSPALPTIDDTTYHVRVRASDNGGSSWSAWGPASGATTLGEEVTVFLTSGTSWEVPDDWNSENNTIEVIGGGGGGANSLDWLQNWPNGTAGGGGGGAYSKVSNVALTPGGSVTYAVGNGGGSGNAGGDTYFCNSTSNCVNINGASVVVGAKGGSGATTHAGVAGGSAASGVGDVKYSGGAGGNNSGGGGGAAGPSGAGKNGGNGEHGVDTGSGGGGGGANGGSSTAGSAGNSGTGGTGGAGTGGTGGGAGGSSSGNGSGSDGSNGGGGGGAGYGTVGTDGGGEGGSDTAFDGTHGSGGGGGGGGTHGNNTSGGHGGLYGGGGGGGGRYLGNAGGSGAQGLVVITYSPEVDASDTWTFTYDSSSSEPTWYQTTAAQFEADTHEDTLADSSDGVILYSGFSTLTYVGGAEASGSSANYAMSLTGLTGGISTAPVAGDIVVVATGFVSTGDGNPGVSTANYTEIADLYANDSRDANLSVNWKIMGESPDTSVTCNGSGSSSNGAVCVAHVWRGVDPNTPMDTTDAEATGTNSAVPNGNAVTPVTQGAVVITAGLGTGSAVDNTITAPTDFVNQVDISADPSSAATVGIASTPWSGSGSVNPAVWTDWTTSGSDSWAASTLALRPNFIDSTVGTTTSTAITYDSVQSAIGWDTVTVNGDVTNGDITVNVLGADQQPLSGYSCTVTGGTCSIDLSTLDPEGTSNHATIYLQAVLENDGGSPTLESWSVSWDFAPIPTPPVLYDTSNDSTQIAFNNARLNLAAPTFRVSALYEDEADGQNFNRFQLQLATTTDFSSQIYTQTFTGTYASGTAYNLTANSLSPSLPTADDTTYYIRVRASGDGGATWGSWSTDNHPVWSYTYDSNISDSDWYQTTAEQFNTGTFTDTETVAGGVTVIGSGPGEISKLGTDTSANSTLFSFNGSHTLVAGENRLVVCVLGAENNGNMTSMGVTYGGVAMHNAADDQTGTASFIARLALFYLLEDELPADGAQTVAATIGGTPNDPEAQLGCAQYEGVAQTPPEDTDTLAEAAPANTTMENTVTSSEGAWVISAMISGNAGNLSHDGTQQEILEIEQASGASSVTAIAEDRDVSAGTVQRSSTFSGTLNRGVRVSVSFAAAAGVSVGTTTSAAILYDSRSASGWDTVTVNGDVTNGDITVNVLGADQQPLSGYSCTVTGGTCSIDLSTLDPEGTSNHATIYLQGVLENDGGSPTLESWSVSWNTVFPSSVTTNLATNVTDTTATLNANLTDTGGQTGAGTNHGFAYSTNATLSSGVSTTSLGAYNGTGEFSDSISSLTPDTTYYFRAFSANGAGTSTGAIQTFTTRNLPSVATDPALVESDKAATLNGNITQTGGHVGSGTNHGFAWGTQPNLSGGDTATTSLGTYDESGLFSEGLNNLTPSTTYYFRAYAANSVGTSTGSIRSFVTPDVPLVVTNPATNLNGIEATLNGTIVSAGGLTITQHGFVYGTDPDLSGGDTATTTRGSGSTGAFNHIFANLEPETTYYFRAYATNAIGTSVGTTHNFTTGLGPAIIRLQDVRLNGVRLH